MDGIRIWKNKWVAEHEESGSSEFIHNSMKYNQTKTKLNSVVLVRKRTIPTERPQPAGEVSANFSW
jgi:hypothetical protein